MLIKDKPDTRCCERDHVPLTHSSCVFQLRDTKTTIENVGTIGGSVLSLLIFVASGVCTVPQSPGWVVLKLARTTSRNQGVWICRNEIVVGMCMRHTLSTRHNRHAADVPVNVPVED